MERVVDPETGYLYLRARYYDPTTAQFLTPDPLYGITGDRYGYAGNDPVNGEDPSGLCKKHKGVWGAIRDTACAGGEVVTDAATHAANAMSGVDAVATLYGEISSGGHCYARGGRTECDGAWSPVSGTPWTMGDVVMNPSSHRLSDAVFDHESKHSTQWAVLGWGFIPAYLIDRGVEGPCNSFEHEAGYGNGGYNHPPNPCQPQQAASCPDVARTAKGPY